MRRSKVIRVATFVLVSFVFGLMALIPLTASAQSPSLSGTWKGRYFYNENRTAVDFTLDLDGANGRCIGHVKEINTFGEKSAPPITPTSPVRRPPYLPGGEFRFHKQYDGTAASRTASTMTASSPPTATPSPGSGTSSPPSPARPGSSP